MVFLMFGVRKPLIRSNEVTDSFKNC